MRLPPAANRRPANRRSRRRGAAAVELAVVAPLLLLLLLGLIQTSMAFANKQVLVHAARVGARHASLPGTTAGSTAEVVQRCLAAGKIEGAEVEVTPNPANQPRGTPIEVRVSVPFTAGGWLQSLGGGVITLKASSVMYRE